MGEWSDYFEDFPEENPANWVNGRLDPAGAKRLLAEKKRLAREQQQLDDEIRQMILKARAKRAQSPHTEYK